MDPIEQLSLFIDCSQRGIVIELRSFAFDYCLFGKLSAVPFSFLAQMSLMWNLLTLSHLERRLQMGNGKWEMGNRQMDIRIGRKKWHFGPKERVDPESWIQNCSAADFEDVVEALAIRSQITCGLERTPRKGFIQQKKNNITKL